MKKHPRFQINAGMKEIAAHLALYHEPLSKELEKHAFAMMKSYVQNGGFLGDLGIMLTNDETLFEGQISEQDQYDMNVMMFCIVQLDDAGVAVDNLYSLVLNVTDGTIYAERPYEPVPPAPSAPTIH